MPLAILAVGIIILFILIVKCKSITKGLGGTLGGLAIVVSFGAMLGKLMADSGGAQRIATTLISMFGVKMFVGLFA